VAAPSSLYAAPKAASAWLSKLVFGNDWLVDCS